VGEKAYALKGTEGQAVGSGFCGQSSFAGKTIAKQSAVVNMKGLVKDEEELKLFSPLGCAFNTGCATVENVAKIQPGQSIAVLGLGGVGMSAIMVSSVLIALGRSPLTFVPGCKDHWL
jgi:Zn-dependent alcohol dehydrogenase